MGQSKDNDRLWKNEQGRKLHKGQEEGALRSDRNHEDKPDAYPEEPARVIEDRMFDRAYPDRSKDKGRGGYGS